MSAKGSVITIGTFDGVHRGHQKLIRETVKCAFQESLKSIVIALERPLKNIKSVLSLPDEKIRWIKELAVDEIIMLSPDSDILSLTPDDFIREFAIGKLNAKQIICGADFAFGKDRKGDLSTLKKARAEFGLKTIVIEPIKEASEIVSSSSIRTSVKNDDIEKANEMLGRNYDFYGMPFRDKGLAGKIGFPTINLKVDDLKLLPHGVFASLVEKKSKLYPCIANIGFRPTLHAEKRLVCEIHILNFNGVWGKTRTQVYLTKRLRGEKKFSSIEALKKQVAQDKEKAKKFFGLF
jgi:riboflavin kinase/FMN adenylyltransferase